MIPLQAALGARRKRLSHGHMWDRCPGAHPSSAALRTPIGSCTGGIQPALGCCFGGWAELGSFPALRDELGSFPVPVYLGGVSVCSRLQQVMGGLGGSWPCCEPGLALPLGPLGS